MDGMIALIKKLMINTSNKLLRTQVMIIKFLCCVESDTTTSKVFLLTLLLLLKTFFYSLIFIEEF